MGTRNFYKGYYYIQLYKYEIILLKLTSPIRIFFVYIDIISLN